MTDFGYTCKNRLSSILFADSDVSEEEIQKKSKDKTSDTVVSHADIMDIDFLAYTHLKKITNVDNADY